MNPFRRSGKTRHRSGEWLAESIGLCGQAKQEFEKKEPGAVALIGDIGSGKTAALDLWKQMAEDEGANVLPFQLNVLSPTDTHQLERVILNRVLDRFGLELGDQAADNLWPHERSINTRRRRKYSPDEDYRLLVEVLRLVTPPVHLLLEECQGPAELFDANEGQDFARWANRLQNLTEAVREGGAFMVATITRSPWDRLPRSCRDGFVALFSTKPMADEISIFLAGGLANTQDSPQRAAENIARYLHDQTEILSFRTLHERCAIAWLRAHHSGADELTVEHFEEQ